MIDPVACVDFLRDNASKLAEAKANRVYLEEFSKSLRATLMKASGETTAAAQEREAYAHADYQRHLEGIREAVRVEEQLKWLMISAQAKIDIWRSMESSARAEQRNTQ